MTTQTLYQQALKFAAQKHTDKGQLVPGTNLPYVVHISNVAMEILMTAINSPGFDLDFAIQVALLHDTLEDTDTTFDEISEIFGDEVAMGVQALTKTDTLPKSDKMMDSLMRVKALRQEVWAVKLADRITNLQPPPPHWDKEKRLKYVKEAEVILENLKGGNDFLEKRLLLKIEEYKGHIL